MGKLDTHPGKSRTVSDERWFALNVAVALIPEMQKRGLSLAKLDEFTGRLLRDGSPHLLVSSVTDYFDLDAEGFLSDLEDDPKSAWLLEPDNPPPKKEPRFEMPPKAVLDRMSPVQRMAIDEKLRLQRLADRAAGREPSDG